MRPELTKIASALTVSRGYSRSRRLHAAQCVVTSRSSSTPVSASTNAPVQIEPSLRGRARYFSARALSEAVSAGEIIKSPPATSSVSIDLITLSSTRRVSIGTLVSVATRPPRSDATITS